MKVHGTVWPLLNMGEQETKHDHKNTGFQDLLTRVAALQYEAGGTSMHLALQKVQDEVLPPNNGRRSSRPTALVILSHTDDPIGAWSTVLNEIARIKNDDVT